MAVEVRFTIFPKKFCFSFLRTQKSRALCQSAWNGVGVTVRAVVLRWCLIFLWGFEQNPHLLRYSGGKQSAGVSPDPPQTLHCILCGLKPNFMNTNENN